jgi:hypothetical protein
MFLAHVWLISSIGHVYAEPELEEPMERVQVEDFTKLVWLKASPGALNHAPYLLILNLYFLFYTWLGIKSIGTGWHSSCIKTDLPVYPCYPHLVVAYR